MPGISLVAIDIRLVSEAGSTTDPYDPFFPDYLKRIVDKSNQPNSGLNYFFFDTPDDMVDTIAQLCAQANPPQGAQLQTLEIVAHGSTIAIDGIDLVNVDAWGKKLKGQVDLVWTPRTQIYLSGCITGLKLPSAGKALQISHAVALATQCEIYGAVGYITGSRAGGDAKTVAEGDKNGIHYGPLDGASDAKGGGCFVQVK